MKGFVVVETNYPTVHAELDVAAGGVIFSAGRRRAAGIDLFQSGGEGNRVERGVDKFREPVGIVAAGVDFGDGVAIDDERLREVRRLDRAAVFGGESQDSSISAWRADCGLDVSAMENLRWKGWLPGRVSCDFFRAFSNLII